MPLALTLQCSHPKYLQGSPETFQDCTCCTSALTCVGTVVSKVPARSDTLYELHFGRAPAADNKS